MPKTDQELYARLDALGINYRTVEHEAAFTVEESKSHRDDLPGGHTKNLFLRDKKKNLWLATVDEDCPINLKQLRHVLGASGNLSFGNADLLMEVLGVIPGSVTAFSVINDTEKRVRMVLDTALMEEELINGHPLRNDRTTAVTPSALMTFLKAEGYDPMMVDFKALADEIATQEAAD
ncbi:prolyl-tRNA synthetase associated domain-containing protein [Curvivirga aplysinae]|uniref:prolyl-tRNA synthetase associated domain-containing protein n=1 Tax=Curvivirga aplysinae TaxID=2529852 RepID=UPI0012BCF820|nr:YbaK/EbsC family protein [Curvivirga aplysinae]MTI09390.1 prolyl-tRNA synthetase associated domain-containing protein [Curvivirga aplysinae]